MAIHFHLLTFHFTFAKSKEQKERALITEHQEIDKFNPQEPNDSSRILLSAIFRQGYPYHRDQCASALRVAEDLNISSSNRLSIFLPPVAGTG